MSVMVVVALLAFGLLIGLSMGAVGAGGSIVAVPVLVYVAGESPKQATASALVVVLITSLVALRPHWAQHRIRFDVAVPFALAGFGGATVGALVTKQVSGDALMLAFSGVLTASATLLARRNRAAATASVAGTVTASATVTGEVRAPLVPAEVGAPRTASAAGAHPSAAAGRGVGGAAGSAAKTGAATPAVRLDVAGGRAGKVRVLRRSLAVGALVGMLTGIFGVGGGFVIVPALALLLGLAMGEAVGTSLLVIAANGAFTLLLKAGDTPLDWWVIAIFAVPAAVGAVAGGEVSRRFDSITLTRWFVRGVAVIAAYTAIRSIADLLG